MEKRRKTRFIVLWWLSGSPQAVMLESRVTMEAFTAVRNGLVIEVKSDGTITHVTDWYWENDAGEHMEATWHQYEKPRTRWSHKYLLVWWHKKDTKDEAGYPHAMIVYDKESAHELAQTYKASLFEVFHRNGKVGEALDYKYFKQDFKPTAYTWKMWTNFAPPRGPWGSLVPAGPRRMC